MLRGYDLSISEFNDGTLAHAKVMKDAPDKKLRNISKHKVYQIVKTFQDMAVLTGDDGNEVYIDKKYLLLD